MRKLILAADVGGTKTSFSLYQLADGCLENLKDATVPTACGSPLFRMASDFLGDFRGGVDAAAFGVAGPVREGLVIAPNLPWSVECGQLSEDLGIPMLYLLNDLEATAWGIDRLPPSAFLSLQKGSPKSNSPRAIIAAGTGLGETIFLGSGKDITVLPTEGGHCDFAPTDETQAALLAHLARINNHVSVERVVSGPGLFSIYNFLIQTGRVAPDSRVEVRLNTEDPAFVVSDEAINYHNLGARMALDIFFKTYGAEAGNLALKSLPYSGLYICGGIAAKLAAEIEAGYFLSSFISKGRLSDLLGDIPLNIVLEPKTAVLGAACFAAVKSEGVVR